MEPLLPLLFDESEVGELVDKVGRYFDIGSSMFNPIPAERSRVDTTGLEPVLVDLSSDEGPLDIFADNGLLSKYGLEPEMVSLTLGEGTLDIFKNGVARAGRGDT